MRLTAVVIYVLIKRSRDNIRCYPKLSIARTAISRLECLIGMSQCFATVVCGGKYQNTRSHFQDAIIESLRSTVPIDTVLPISSRKGLTSTTIIKSYLQSIPTPSQCMTPNLKGPKCISHHRFSRNSTRIKSICIVGYMT